MSNLEFRLSQPSFLILDGALATELEKKGANLNDPLWSAKVLLDQPELIKETHLQYLKSGADIISTSTYQATFQGFSLKGISKKNATALFQLSVHLANEARDIFTTQAEGKPLPLIAGSIGPYGAFLADGSEYRGDYALDKNALKNFHQERVAVLIDSGVDMLLFETIPNLTEMQAILELLEESTHCPSIISFSCRDGKLADGSSFEEAVWTAAQQCSIYAVGVNCLHPDMVAPLFRRLNDKINKPLLAYPNNGNLWDAHNKCWIGSGQNMEMEQLWPEWIRLGIKIIGGCCNTTPKDIQQLANFRENLFQQA